MRFQFLLLLHPFHNVSYSSNFHIHIDIHIDVNVVVKTEERWPYIYSYF